MDSLEYRLDDPGEIDPDINKKNGQKKYIIIVSILIFVILVLTILFIIELIRA